VKPASACTTGLGERKGTGDGKGWSHLLATGNYWQDGKTVEVSGGYCSMGAAGYKYTLVLKDGKWVVESEAGAGFRSMGSFSLPGCRRGSAGMVYPSFARLTGRRKGL